MALDLKRINNLPWYTQLGLFLVLGGIVAGSGWYFFVSGLSEQIAIKQTKLNTLKIEIQRGQAVEQKHQEFQTQNKHLLEKLATLKIILPEAKQTDQLLRQVQAGAVGSGLLIKRFQPMPVVQRDFFSEWPINMEVEGNYHSLGIFFDKVSKFSRIVNVSNLKIAETPKKDNPARTVAASCTATTFVYNETIDKAEEALVTSGGPKAKKGPAKK